MLILIFVMLTLIAVLWIVFPFFVKRTTRTDQETALLHDDIEKELESLRHAPTAKDENISDTR